MSFVSGAESVRRSRLLSFASLLTISLAMPLSASAQTAIDPDAALLDVIRATYIRGRTPKTDAEIQALRRQSGR